MKKPIKSGRRPISGLEKRPQKKKQNNVTIQIENNDHMQCIGNETNISSFSAYVGYSFIPSLSQFSQEFDMSKSNSTMSNLIEGSLMPHAETYQFTPVFNPILNKSAKTSLTQLLQQQMTKQQVSGAHDEVRFNNSTQESCG